MNLANGKALTVGMSTKDVDEKLLFENSQLDWVDFQHYIFRQLTHGNFNSPIEDDLTRGIKVLDAGCGHGLWTVDMAYDYPDSRFTGHDINEVFPGVGVEIPTNCTFLKADTLSLPFEDKTFDYVFQRLLSSYFTLEEWTKAIQEIVRVTKPGGWIELVECNLIYNRQGPNYQAFQNALSTATLARGIDLTVTDRLDDLLTSAGVDVVEFDHLICPMSGNGRVGALASRCAQLSVRACRNLPGMNVMSEQQYELIFASLPDEFTEYKTFAKIPYACGRKRA